MKKIRHVFAALATYVKARAPKAVADLTSHVLAAVLVEATTSGHPDQVMAEGFALVTVLMLRS